MALKRMGIVNNYEASVHSQYWTMSSCMLAAAALTSCRHAGYTELLRGCDWRGWSWERCCRDADSLWHWKGSEQLCIFRAGFVAVGVPSTGVDSDC